MRVAIFSDLHLEDKIHGQATQPWLFDHAHADVVVLAGDIHTKGRGVQWAQETFSCPVIYVPGNHEGWGEHWQKIIAEMKQAALNSNVHVLNNDSVVINGVRFLGSTLWTTFDAWPNRQEAMFEAGQGRDMYMPGMRDYKYIRTAGYRKILPRDTVEWANQSRNFLLQQPAFDGPTIVVSHHAPVLEGLRHQKVTEVYDAAYANDWEDGVKSINPTAWIYGHTHTPYRFMVGCTHMVSHPVGHLSEKLDPLYQSVMEITAHGCVFQSVPNLLVEPPAPTPSKKAKV